MVRRELKEAVKEYMRLNRRFEYETRELKEAARERATRALEETVREHMRLKRQFEGHTQSLSTWSSFLRHASICAARRVSAYLRMYATHALKEAVSSRASPAGVSVPT